MTTASHTVTFSNSCLAEGSGGSVSDSDFCRKLVRDVILSPTTDRTDPCPHLFLRYYTNSMAPVEVFITQGLVNLENFIIERQYERLVNTSGTSLSLSFCSVGDETFTWEDAGTYNCPNSGDGVVIDGQDISVPGIGVLDIHYNSLYYPIEVTTFISQETTVIVCQAGKATTYTFTPDWCGSCSQVVGSQCCRDSDRTPLSLGNVSLVRGTTVVIAASGGCPPYRWNKPIVYDVDFYTLSGETDSQEIPGNPLCGGDELVTEASAIKAVVGNNACGSGSITVTDYCGSTASGTIYALPPCCGDLDLSVVGDNTFDISPGSSTPIEVEDGQAPYNWVVVGTRRGVTFGLSVEHAQTDIPLNNVLAANDACYDPTVDQTRVTVVCSDNCGHQVAFSFLPTNYCCPPSSPVTWDEDLSADTITQNGQAVVVVGSGIPPFTWEITAGQGYTFSNGQTTITADDYGGQTVYASASSCGTCDVDVTDACGGTASGAIRNIDSGHWSSTEETVCGHYRGNIHWFCSGIHGGVLYRYQMAIYCYDCYTPCYNVYAQCDRFVTHGMCDIDPYCSHAAGQSCTDCLNIWTGKKNWVC